MGKTTLLEKLIPELKRRGYRVATIKHDAHNFDIDHPGKDTWRHAQAGADVVVISSPVKFAMIAKVEEERSLDELVTMLPPVDIVLTEGYKRGNKPKIEVFRAARGEKELLCRPEELLAIASDVSFDIGVPVYGLDDVAGLADLIEEKFLKKV
ncbi:molybdopterin-guanine dinucleotide biosynthesis protein MobB [Calderihabitans maritimus]|uniref:Molybdopterin-guanine dinucleotide biosynthesis protein MobB n=2 Tax=Calderihabitans maritimus TaxID=1246530 RepID=A0A1Z5HR92_9FIRM|nr:molybdopterin-guanine dinucleotide biosynthesis protein MobB [Calderihabitans maritimus]